MDVEKLEDIHNHLLEFGKNIYVEDRIALLKVLKHINCIIDNYSSYEDNESIYNKYVELRKLIVEWINFSYINDYNLYH